MDKQTRVNLLCDYYGHLLTTRQRRFIELYYGQDYSLGEISEQFGVSRQSVYDILKRSERAMERYEEKLKLVTRAAQQAESISRAISLLENGDRAGIRDAVKVLHELLETE